MPEGERTMQRLMRVRDTAALLAVTTKNVRALIDRGELATVTIEGRVRVRPEDAEALVLRLRLPKLEADREPTAPPAGVPHAPAPIVESIDEQRARMAALYAKMTNPNQRRAFWKGLAFKEPPGDLAEVADDYVTVVVAQLEAVVGKLTA